MKRLLSHLLLGGLLTCPSISPAEDESLLLIGATVHPVSGPVIQQGQILIRGAQIAALGQQLHAPNATVVQLDGLHLYPGLIAPTTLLGLVEINAVRATLDMTEVGDYTPDVQSWIAINPDSELIPVARANGITHVLPVPLGGIVSGQSGLVQLAGWTSEDMAVVKPLGLHVFWPSMELDTRPRGEFPDKAKFKSLTTQARERRARLESMDLFFREAQAYARARDPQAPVPAWEAMLPYVQGEKRVFIHADEVRQLRSAIAWARTNKFSFVIAGGRDAWKVADELAGLDLIYEHTFTLPADDAAPHDIQFRAPALLQSKGVRVSFSEGLDRSGAASLRNLPYSAAQAVAAGLSPDEALKGITLYPAMALGVADQLGSLAPGKEASLFAADGDILDVRTQVKRLWIAGRETSLQTRHTRLYDKYRTRPLPAAGRKNANPERPRL